MSCTDCFNHKVSSATAIKLIQSSQPATRYKFGFLIKSLNPKNLENRFHHIAGCPISPEFNIF